MTVDYVPIANGVSANVESQAQFLLDLAPGGALQNGFQAGLAPSSKFNKAFRQQSMMTSALANLIANTLGGNVLDDGNLAALITLLTNTIQQTAAAGAWSTGDVKLTMKSAADATWVLCNDGSIGDATSAATTRANADTAALFTLLWTNVGDSFAPVSGGRGGSAAADFAAHKRLTLTKMLGRSLAVAGAGSGLTNRVLGTNLGEETHLQTVSEMPSHNHPGSTMPLSTNSNPGSIAMHGVNALLESNSPITVASQGGGAAFNVMQPTSFLNAMIKL